MYNLVEQIKLKNLFEEHRAAYKESFRLNNDEVKKKQIKKFMWKLEGQIRKITSPKVGNLKQNSTSTYFKVFKDKSKINYRHKIFSKNKSLAKVNNDSKKRQIQYFVQKYSVVSEEPQKQAYWKWMLDDSKQDTNMVHCDIVKKLKLSPSKDETNSIDTDNENTSQPQSPKDTNSDCNVQQNLDSVKNESQSNETAINNCDKHAENNAMPKDEFLRIVGLVHKSEMANLQKSERSRTRRKTANPQFSHAAIEAKRITKLVMLNERKHRRQMALEKKKSLQNKATKSKSSNQSSDESEDFSKSLCEIFPGLFLTSHRKNSKAQNCILCKKSCNWQNESCVSCQKCSNIFHINCLHLEQRESLTHVIPRSNGCFYQKPLKCLYCHPRLYTDEEFQLYDTFDQLYQVQKNLRHHVEMLTNSNQLLEQFINIKLMEKNQLNLDIENLTSKAVRMENILSNLIIQQQQQDGDDSNWLIPDENQSLLDVTSDGNSLNDSLSSNNSRNGNSPVKHSISNHKEQIEEYSIVSSCA